MESKIKSHDVIEYFFCRDCKVLKMKPKEKIRLCKCGCILKLQRVVLSELLTMEKFTNDLGLHE